MPKFLNNLDLNGNQLLNPVIHVSSQSTTTNGPNGDTTGTEGQIFYNSHSNGKALYFRDNSGWRPIGDISGVTAGAGLSGGGTGGDVTLAIDISEFSDVTPANGDKILTLDSDGSTEQLTTIASLATLFAGSGLTATNSVIAVDTLNQDTTGTADHVTIVDNENTDEENQITFIEGTGGAGSRGLEADGDFTYNPSSGRVTATILKANSLDIDSGGADINGTLEANTITIGGNNILSDGIITTLGTITQDTILFQSSASDDPLLTLENTANDATGARIQLLKDRGATPGDGDVLGEIIFSGDDSGQNQTNYVKLRGLTADVTHGAEGGKFEVRVATHDGEMQPGLIIQDGDAEDEIDVTIGNGANSAVTVPGSLTVTGNLTINGATTTVSTTNLNVEDAIIMLQAEQTGSSSTDMGIIMERGSTGNNAAIIWDEGADKFQMGTTTETGADTDVTITTGTLVANIEGNLTGTIQTASQTNITGVGTISTGVWQGTAIASAYLDADTAHLTTNQTFTGTKTFEDGRFSNSETDEVGTIRIMEAADNGTNFVSILSEADLSNSATTVTIPETGDATFMALFDANPGSTSITSTPAELNLLDGSSASTVVNSKGVVYGSSGQVAATTIELGHASDTTLARSAAGKATIEGQLIGVVETFHLDHSDGHVEANNTTSDSTEFTITHGMGDSRFYKVEVIQDSGNYDTVYVDVTRPSDTTIKVTFGAAVANGAYRAMVTRMA